MNHNFLINDFEGPLDLLLHLVKISKMDIYEINTTDIINQYLEYIHQMENLNIDVASEYLVMASELVHLKSKLLLNIDTEEDEEDTYSINSEEDLKHKIAEYEKYKDISNEFHELEEKRKEVFTKLPESLSEYAEDGVIINSDLTINDLLNSFLQYQERHKFSKPLNTKVTRKEFSINERVNNIRNILKQRKRINFIELFDNVTKPYVIVTLLSILEMTKNNEINLVQKKNFSEIQIEMRA